jgi:MFS family permease
MAPDTQAASATALARDPRLVAIVVTSATALVGTQSVPPALPAIQSGLSVSAARIGLVLTAFFLPATLFGPLVGAAADIYGRRPVVLGSLGTLGLAGVAAAFAPSFEVLLALRAIQGAAFSGTLPLSVALIGDFFEGPAGTTAQGIRSSAHGIVIVVVPAVAGALAGYGWNVPFLLYGGALLAFVLVYVTFPEATDADGAAGSDGADAGVSEQVAAYFGRIADSLRDRTLATLILGGFAVFLVRNGVLALVPLYVVQGFGGDTVLAGLLLSVMGVTRTVASPFSGRLLVATSRRRAFVATMGLVALSMGVLVLAPSVAWLGVGVAGFGVGMALFNPMLNDAVTASATTESRAGVVSSMVVFKNAANAAGPAGFTVLAAAAGFGVAFGVAGAIGLAYVGVVLLEFDENDVAAA